MRKFFAVAAAVLMSASVAFAFGYNYVSADQVKEWIEAGTPMTIVDIQVEEEFEAHHLPGSVATYAYPVKSDTEKAKIDKAVSKSIADGYPVVIVCPRGGGGAKRCYDYMKSSKVPEKQLLILKNGMAGWPHEDLVETGK